VKGGGGVPLILLLWMIAVFHRKTKIGIQKTKVREFEILISTLLGEFYCFALNEIYQNVWVDVLLLQFLLRQN